MRFRFTIRDLLWLTLVAALGVGWWLDHWLQSEWRRGAESQMEIISRWYTKNAEILMKLERDHPELFQERSGPIDKKRITATDHSLATF